MIAKLKRRAVMQGIDLALRKRGYASIDNLKAGKKR